MSEFVGGVLDGSYEGECCTGGISDWPKCSSVPLWRVIAPSTPSMANPPGLKNLSNVLVTPDQLSDSSSSIDGVPSDLETSIRCAGVQLTQTAGVLLRLSQDIIAQAIVTFTRFWLGADGGSLRVYAVKVGVFHYLRNFR